MSFWRRRSAASQKDHDHASHRLCACSPVATPMMPLRPARIFAWPRTSSLESARPDVRNSFGAYDWTKCYDTRCGWFFDEPKVIFGQLFAPFNGLIYVPDCKVEPVRTLPHCFLNRTSGLPWLASIIRTHPVGPAFFPSKLAAEGSIFRLTKLAGSSMTLRTRASLRASSSGEIPTFTLKWLNP
jgi:hypothetical protein